MRWAHKGINGAVVNMMEIRYANVCKFPMKLVVKYKTYVNKNQKKDASYAQAVISSCFLTAYAMWPHSSATTPAPASHDRP